MNLFQRGKTWYVDFENSEGKRLRLSTGQSDEKLAKIRAVELMQTHLVDALNDTERRQLGSHATLGSVLTRCYQDRWAAQGSARGRRYLVGMLVREVGHWQLHTVTYSRLDAYARERMREGDKAATINRKMSAICTAMREALKRGELQSVPPMPHFQENNIKERYLSVEEEQAMLAYFEANTAPADIEMAYMRDLLVTLLDTGFRCSEALGLIPERVTGGDARLPAGKGGGDDPRQRTKSGRARSVPLTTRAQEAVDRLLASPLHGKLDSAYVGRRWRLIAKRLGMKDVTIHTMRHTCASRLVQGGVDLYVVSRWLGHSSVEVTKRYANLSTENLKAAASVLQKSDRVTASEVAGEGAATGDALLAQLLVALQQDASGALRERLQALASPVVCA